MGRILRIMAPKRQSRKVAASATRVSPAPRPKVKRLSSASTWNEAAQTQILRRAAEVIGSEDAALRWMGTPVRALNYATPISMLHDESGFEAVRVVLGRLEHGVL